LQSIVQMWRKSASANYPPVRIVEIIYFVIVCLVFLFPFSLAGFRCFDRLPFNSFNYFGFEKCNQAMYQFGLALERGVAHTTGGRANDLVESFKYDTF